MLTIGIETWTSNLHVNQGGKLTLQTEWNRTLLKAGCPAGCLRKSSLWIVPVPARLTCKNSWFERRAQNLVESHARMRKLNFAKKLFRKLSRDNLCNRSLNSRPRYFKLSVKQTVDNNSYIRKNEKRFVNNWCCTWKSRDLNAAIVGRLPLSSFSVSVSP